MAFPSDKERKDWWLKVYAHTSFEKGIECCELLLSYADTTLHPLYLPLCTAVHVFYGRPFKKHQGLGKTGCKLTRDYVPLEWRGLHDCLMTFRDQLLVHTDPEHIEQAGRPIHEVVYHKWGFSTSDPRPQLYHFCKVKRYLETMKERTVAEIENFNERFQELLPRKGDHVLMINGPILFKPFVPPQPNLFFEGDSGSTP